MVDRPGAGSIAAVSASREGRILARSILATADDVRIIGDLDSFCTARLGSGVKDVFFCELSVGAAFGLSLRDDRQVLLKVHPPDRTLRFLEAVYRMQQHLYARGFPCPEPICGPLPFARGLAAVEAFVDEGKVADAHEPEIRREMARALARVIDLSGGVPDVEGLLQAWKLPPDHGLWLVPHNALFDFEATVAGAEWIDEIASKARRVLDSSPGRMVVAHADWSAKHFRFEDGKVCVVYDWDSLRLDKETTLVGHTATHFPYTEYYDVPRESRRSAALHPRVRDGTRSTVLRTRAYSRRCGGHVWTRLHSTLRACHRSRGQEPQGRLPRGVGALPRGVSGRLRVRHFARSSSIGRNLYLRWWQSMSSSR